MLNRYEVSGWISRESKEIRAQVHAFTAADALTIARLRYACDTQAGNYIDRIRCIPPSEIAPATPNTEF